MSKKSAYVDKARAKIDEHSARLDELKAKIRGEIADQRIEGEKRIEQLESKLEAAKTRLGEIADSSEEKWEDLSRRFEALTDEVGSSVRKFFGK